jgi:hypothetical protein
MTKCTWHSRVLKPDKRHVGLLIAVKWLCKEEIRAPVVLQLLGPSGLCQYKTSKTGRLCLVSKGSPSNSGVTMSFEDSAAATQPPSVIWFCPQNRNSENTTAHTGTHLLRTHGMPKTSTPVGHREEQHENLQVQRI